MPSLQMPVSQHDSPANSHNEPVQVGSYFPQDENGQAAFDATDLLNTGRLPDA